MSPKSININPADIQKLLDGSYQAVPITPRSKAPIIKDWIGHAFRPGEWGAEDGIGIKCGPVVAIDVDIDDPEILSAVERLIPKDAPRKRGRKGFTAFIRAELTRKRSIHVGFTPLDGKLKLGSVELLTYGQQCVIPPTRHPETGEFYQWTPSGDGVTRSLYTTPLHKLPHLDVEPWIEQLENTLKPHTLPRELINSVKRVANASVGERNNVFNNEVYRLASGSAEIPKALARKWLMVAAAFAGLAEPEILSTWNSASKAGDGTHHAQRKPVSMIELGALMIKDLPPVRFLLPGVIPEGFSILAGRPKIGKSLLATDLALACALGDRECLGTLPNMVGEVLYAALEDSEARLKDRICRMLGKYELTSVQGARLTFCTAMPRLGEGGMQIIEAWALRARKPALILIDTLVRVRKPVGVRDRQYEADYEAGAELQRLAHELGVPVIGLTHQRKLDAEDPIDTITGSLGLSAAADTVMVFGSEQGLGKSLFIRGRDVEEQTLAVRLSKATLCWEMQGRSESRRFGDQKKRLLDTLDASTEPMSLKELAEACDLTTIKACEHLKELIDKGLAEKTRHGFYVAA